MKTAKLILGLSFLSFSLNTPADWPQWLGPNRDGHSSSGDVLVVPKSMPQPAWKLEIGGGFSSPIVSAGKLIYMDDHEGTETVHCLDAFAGKEIWQAPISPAYSDEWGTGTRSTPSIDGNRVYILSCIGELRCLSLKDGKVLWGKSFDKDFGVKFLGSKANEGTARRRGNNGSPLIDGPDLIAPVGSPEKGTLICFDKMTGAQKWSSGEDEAAYSSPIVHTFGGIKQVIYINADALTGTDRQTGKQLWRIPLKTNAKRHASTPIVFEDSVIVNSHTFGLLAFQVTKEADGAAASKKWVNTNMKINLSTLVLFDGFLYGQGPAKNFACVDAATGLARWVQTGFGKENSSTMAIGKNLAVLTDEGEMVFIDPSPNGYKELLRTQVCGKNWNFPAFSDSTLFVRDYHQLQAFPLAAAH